MKPASRALFAVAWLLLVAGLGVLALNPGVPSLSYALLWLGVVAVARGISMLISDHDEAVEAEARHDTSRIPGSAVERSATDSPTRSGPV
jgi:hypothetical protein